MWIYDTNAVPENKFFRDIEGKTLNIRKQLWR